MSDDQKVPRSDQSGESDPSDKSDRPEADLAAEGGELARLAAERDRLNDQFLRAKAELSNYQKRAEREREMAALHFKRDFVRALLPALDALDLAIKHGSAQTAALVAGVQGARDALEQALVSEGAERIRASGTWDPDLHHPQAIVERADVPDGTILEEVRAGYRVGALVARHGEVVVSRRPVEGPKAGPQQPSGEAKPPEGRGKP